MSKDVVPGRETNFRTIKPAANAEAVTPTRRETSKSQSIRGWSVQNPKDASAHHLKIHKNSPTDRSANIVIERSLMKLFFISLQLMPVGKLVLMNGPLWVRS